MKTILAVGVLLLSLTAARAEEKCDSLECMLRDLTTRQRDVASAMCDLEKDAGERVACLMRLTPAHRACSTKPTPAEQIKCLDAALDQLVRSLPGMIAREVEYQPKPRLHQ